MSLLRGIVEEVLEVNQDYVIARCHQSVRFDHSTFDFKFTRNLDKIKEGYVWVLDHDYGEILKENRTAEDAKMMKEFGESLKQLSENAQKEHKLKLESMTDEERGKYEADKIAFWEKIRKNSYPLIQIKKP